MVCLGDEQRSFSCFWDCIQVLHLDSSVNYKKARELQKNIYFCFIDYAKAFDYVDHNILWKILKEMGIPDHLTCLLRNLYADQEATVRTGHGTTDWFQIGKGVCQGCIYHLAYLTYMQSAAAKSLQLCPTLWDPIDGSPPGSPVPGILQARTLEWAAIFFFNAWKWKVKVKSLSRIWLFRSPWTAAYQAPLSRQELLEWGAIGFVYKSKAAFSQRTRWQRSRWVWSTSLSTDTSGIHLRHRSAGRTLAERSTWPAEKNI